MENTKHICDSHECLLGKSVGESSSCAAGPTCAAAAVAPPDWLTLAECACTTLYVRNRRRPSAEACSLRPAYHRRKGLGQRERTDCHVVFAGGRPQAAEEPPGRKCWTPDFPSSMCPPSPGDIEGAGEDAALPAQHLTLIISCVKTCYYDVFY